VLIIDLCDRIELGYYFTGDGSLRDKDGFYWITGRVDGASLLGFD
jgi:acyl-coenzyme A synthetase/AMP-(fatty) acid ligase